LTEHLDLAGTPPVRIHLRRSARARRLSLRVSRLDGRVTLTLPPGAPHAAAEAFAAERAAWIRGHLADLAAPETVGLGTRLPVEGRALTIAAGDRCALLPEAGLLTVPRRAAAVPDAVPGAVAGLLKAAARDRLTAACDRHAAQVGRAYTRLVLRDPRGRWGSCSSAGALMFSWRLILAPPDVLDYVAAHEVAHLVEMNHAPAFWAVVARLRGVGKDAGRDPGHDPGRTWLRREGAALHRFRFAPPDPDAG